MMTSSQRSAVTACDFGMCPVRWCSLSNRVTVLHGVYIEAPSNNKAKKNFYSASASVAASALLAVTNWPVVAGVPLGSVYPAV